MIEDCAWFHSWEYIGDHRFCRACGLSQKRDYGDFGMRDGWNKGGTYKMALKEQDAMDKDYNKELLKDQARRRKILRDLASR